MKVTIQINLANPWRSDFVIYSVTTVCFVQSAFFTHFIFNFVSFRTEDDREAVEKFFLKLVVQFRKLDILHKFTTLAKGFNDDDLAAFLNHCKLVQSEQFEYIYLPKQTCMLSKVCTYFANSEQQRQKY